MICTWAMSCFADAKVVVTANTEKQLMTKTMSEIGKWFRLVRTSAMFKTTATSIYSNAEGHDRTWRVDAIPWSDNNTEAFAGLHNKGRIVVMIFDEGSAIADKVWEVAEGAMTDDDTIIIWLVFGNPTRNSGRFRECFSKYKHRWRTRHIDSRTVEGTNKTQLDQWVQDYGEDSDFVRVRVRGEFPRAGTMQFISSEDVENARRRPAEAFLDDPFTMAVDVARFGEDMTVISHMRGRDAKSIPWTKMRGADTMAVADRVAELWRIHKHDAVFVDGGGVGGGVVDRLRRLNVPVIEVQFGGKPTRSSGTGDGDIIYANKRAEMWGYMRDWMRGGMIPDDGDLASELTGVEFGYVMKEGRDAILLEKKEDMKKRGLASPDSADSLAMHFASAIAPTNHRSILNPDLLDTSKQYDNYHPLSRQVARNVGRNSRR